MSTKMFSLTGKVVLITGAQQGMGKADSISMAAQGAKAAVTGMDEKKCQAVADEIKKSGGEAAAFVLDVTKADQVDRVITDVVKKWGRLDVLVNNAGIYFAKPALELTEAEWDRMIDTNLKGQFLCAQRAAKEMAKNKWGRIINIASIASGGVGVGFSGGVHYTASKGGIIAMTETMAAEWGPLGITVNAIGPGAIQTPMLDDAGVTGDATKALTERLPLKRIGRPEEIAAMVVFLASEESSYATGATFYVDGGWLAT